MREVASPHCDRLIPAIEHHAHRDLALLHDALAVGLFIRRIATAAARHQHVIEVKVEPGNIEIIDACITDGCKNSAKIRIRSEKCGFHQWRMADGKTNFAAFIFVTPALDLHGDEFCRALTVTHDRPCELAGNRRHTLAENGVFVTRRAVDLGHLSRSAGDQDKTVVSRCIAIHGDRIKCFVVEVKQGLKGPEIMLSRSHPALVKQLFALEVPEITDRIVEIMAVAREAGHRTKIAVRSHRAGVSPKGSLIGPMGSRSQAVMNELNGEKIDIIDWSEDPATFVANALAPAKVSSVTVVDEFTRSAKVVVPDYQLSLAIGKDGQNARLAARLTGWRIDIHPDNPV